MTVASLERQLTTHSITLPDGRVIRGGVVAGGINDPINMSARSMCRSVEKFCTDGAAVRAANATNDEISVRLQGLANSAVPNLNRDAAAMEAAIDKLESEERSASFVTPRSAGEPFWLLQEDLEIGRLLRAADHSTSSLLKQAVQAPWQHFRVAEAILRLPLVLSGATLEDFTTLRVALLRTLAPQRWQAVEIGREQVDSAKYTAAKMLAAMCDVWPGVHGAVIRTAPHFATLAGVLSRARAHELAEAVRLGKA